MQIFSRAPGKTPPGQAQTPRPRRFTAGLFGLATIGLALSFPSYAKDITFVTDFGINGRHAYYFVALEKGYYKEAGLNVTIVRGQGSADAIKKVAAGAAQVGFADAGSLVLARGNDNVPVKLISVIYQSPPQAIYTLEGSGIKGPKDLVGRKIADTASSAMLVLFGAYAKAAGIPKDGVSWIVADGNSLATMLATGRVDAIGQFTVGEPLLEKAVAPRKLVRLAYKDVGLEYYGNGIIASEEMIKNDPETLRKFVNATIKGMKEAFRDPVAAGEILHRAYKQVDADVATGETRMVAELAVVKNGAMGSVEPARIDQTISVLSSAYPMKRSVTRAEVYAPGFVGGKQD
ncbi:MAG: Membrane lipoprotein lipid attachment site [Herbaspirillum sp.]|jgi:NitT/TauT family transport system substrate-binding protein|nr:Membrane lipoprotein lipid attachment site [Herbaspirillum sp.]